MDVVTIGGVTVDAFFQIDNSKDVIRLDKTTGELRIRSGEKIDVDTCRFSLGGNACNVAVGLSRLGFATALCAEMGTDEFAQKITHGLEKEDINTQFLLQTQGAASSFTIALNVENDRTLFVARVVRKHNFAIEQITAPWIYITSLGDEWEHVYKKVLILSEQGDKKIVFNPGTSQLENVSEVIQQLLTKTYILCVNKQEAQKLLKFYGEEASDISDILRHCKKIGPQIVSITDGAKGGFCIDEDDRLWNIDRFPTPVLERTGAGDAYATGFMAAVMQKIDASEAMRWGSLNAAGVIEKIGAEEGLLQKTELEEKLTTHKDFVAKQL